MKVLFGNTIFTSTCGETGLWSSEPGKGLAACSAKEATSFLSYFKTLSVESNPGPPALQSSALPSKQSCHGYKRCTGR